MLARFDSTKNVILSLWSALSLSNTTTNTTIKTGREERHTLHTKQNLHGSVSFDRSLSILHSSQVDDETHASTSTKRRVRVSLYGTDM